MQVRSATPDFCRGLQKQAGFALRFRLITLIAVCLMLQGIAAAADGSPITISLTPSSASITSGQQVLFVAFVTGTSNTAVTWKASAGTVTSGGLFTAPNVSSTTTATITATSAANPKLTASAAITISASTTPPPPPPPPPSGSCGPPNYGCSRSDTAVLVATAPPQLGSDPNFYGGHKGAGMVAKDPDYGNRILRVTDGLTHPTLPGISFNTPASAEKNITSYDETLFILRAEGSQACLFQFDKVNFRATLRSCNLSIGGAGAEFGYTAANNDAVYNWVGGRMYRFVIDRTNWTASADPKFNGTGYFDADSPQCLAGQIAANRWRVHDHAMSSDDQTAIAAIGVGQDKDQYYVVWNAAKGCQWLDVKNWQVSRGWNTGMSSPVKISWKSGPASYANTGGAHNAQIDRSGAYGVLTVNGAKIGHKLFWTIGTNIVDDSCINCASHWACDYGICFWNQQKGSGYSMSSAPIGATAMTLNMNNVPAMGMLAAGEHSSHANASPGAKNPYLVSWDTNLNAVHQIWQNELTGVNWDGSQRTIRFNKVWNSGKSGFWSTSRCPISRQGNYALCGSDYQFLNMDLGFGNGLNQDTCDHTRNAGRRGTNSCRTDVLLFELK